MCVFSLEPVGRLFQRCQYPACSSGCRLPFSSSTLWTVQAALNSAVLTAPHQPAQQHCPCCPAGVSGGLTYFAYQAVQHGAPLIPHAPLGLLSALMTLFLVYNILAGGNPPPKEKPAAVAA